MTFESLTNRGEYLSAHYLAAVLPTTLKAGLLKRWTDEEKAGRVTPRAGLRGLRRDYFSAKAELADAELFGPDRLRKLHAEVLAALCFEPSVQTITVERAGREHEITVPFADLAPGHGILAVEGGWATDTDAAHDPTDAGRLLAPLDLDGGDTIESSTKLVSWLFATESPPRYVLILNGGVVTLADRMTWGEGRYLAVSLDTAYGRNDDRELEVVAALFGADSLRPPAEGGAEPLAELVAGSRQHAVGVSGELREGLRISVELIANEVLDRIRQEGYRPQDVMDLDELAKELGREALRYLYRVLFLLYAEARPELGVLPVDDPEYVGGYSLSRLGDLIARQLAPSAEAGFHLYESLDLLFRMVNDGHRPRSGQAVGEKDSDDVGLRFEPMRSDLFLPSAIALIGRQIPEPGSDPDDPDGPRLDTRLRNATLYRVLRLLMLTRGAKKRRGGFISYAQLGINQLGAVYEGLMSYTGFVATEQLYEVAKNGDPKDGSWMIPASKADEYDDGVFVVKENPITGVRSRVSYEPGSFVYRLAGRDRQTSASYYTPHSLTEVTVQLALKYRLDQDGTVTPARELLDWTICEPALGSGAFLNEAIDQVAAEYLRRRQKELGEDLEPEDYHLQLQRVKAYIALHNCYGVDLNRTAVELAEVSLWLNVMHAGLQAPWFGLHLRRGNSLIGGRRQTYTPAQLADKSWLTTAPKDQPFRDGPIDEGSIQHFLLPADGWGAVAGEKEARELAPAETERLKKWRSAMKKTPTTRGKSSQVARLQALARRVEFLWDLVQQRLKISEREIRREIHVWGADDLPSAVGAVPREKILADLETPGTPYWRLKTLMDVWCALWFWPLDAVGLLDGSAEEYTSTEVEVTRVKEVPAYEEPTVYETVSLFDEVQPQQLKMPTRTGSRKVMVAQQMRRRMPLRDLEDWLAFAEALVGRADIPRDSMVGHFFTLADLADYEAALPGLTGSDEAYRLADSMPWLKTASAIAAQQGFLHWELSFAHLFTGGGFDVQVGNPPWVQLRWTEGAVLAEHAPWFKLVDKPPNDVWIRRKEEALREKEAREFYMVELAVNSGIVACLGLSSTYPLAVGTKPDLYRAFMCRSWANLGASGVACLVHPDTHLSGAREGALRAAAYSHLRFHAHFHNRRGIFPEIHANTEFGIHVYGIPGPIGFGHSSWLFDPSTLALSLNHDASGALPAIKYKNHWDIRPHRSRIIQVDEELLAAWASLISDEARPVRQTPLLYPVTSSEQSAISSLSRVSGRLGQQGPFITIGFDEGKAKREGILKWSTWTSDQWSDVVVQGPHIGVASPLNKQPNIPCRTNRDWSAFNLSELPHDAVPRTNYVRVSDLARYRSGMERWNGRPYVDYFRLAWRRMIAFDSERSLFAAVLPPGPAHIDAVNSMAFDDSRLTALYAGAWASLPADYLLRVTGRADLRGSEARRMPAVDLMHPLAGPLLIRAMRLNCLTRAHAPLWRQLFSSNWSRERWALNWPAIQPLADNLSDDWKGNTPFRSSAERRAALVEIDALMAVWWGIDAEGLLAMYRSRFPILADYETQMWFDANGRKLASNHHAFGQGQTKAHYEQLVNHLNGPAEHRAPDGYQAPFYKADRESEYQQAHAAFCRRLKDAVDAGWRPS